MYLSIELIYSMIIITMLTITHLAMVFPARLAVCLPGLETFPQVNAAKESRTLPVT